MKRRYVRVLKNSGLSTLPTWGAVLRGKRDINCAYKGLYIGAQNSGNLNPDDSSAINLIRHSEIV